MILKLKKKIKHPIAEKYQSSNIGIEQILNIIKSNEIAITKIQLPFVWKPKQVRDLIDRRKLYHLILRIHGDLELRSMYLN